MKNLLITYVSKTGITKKYAEEINKYLIEKGIKTALISIEDFNPELFKNVDGVLFGAWTHGLMILLQHPDKPWVKFAKALPDMKDKKVGLFTTYKLATGRMFRMMKKHLDGKISGEIPEMKSKKGELSENDKAILNNFIK
jgi:flavodoxin